MHSAVYSRPILIIVNENQYYGSNFILSINPLSVLYPQICQGSAAHPSNPTTGVASLNTAQYTITKYDPKSSYLSMRVAYTLGNDHRKAFVDFIYNATVEQPSLVFDSEHPQETYVSSCNMHDKTYVVLHIVLAYTIDTQMPMISPYVCLFVLLDTPSYHKWTRC